MTLEGPIITNYITVQTHKVGGFKAQISDKWRLKHFLFQIIKFTAIFRSKTSFCKNRWGNFQLKFLHFSSQKFWLKTIKCLEEFSDRNWIDFALSQSNMRLMNISQSKAQLKASIWKPALIILGIFQTLLD